MTQDTNRVGTIRGRRSTAGVIAVALMLSAFGLTNCGVVNAAKKVVHNVEGNKATIGTFTNNIQSGEATAFEATYVTTGSSPATIVYAVQPPKGLAFQETPSGASTSSGGTNSLDIIVNSSGEYSCLPSSRAPGSNSGWSCEKLPATNAAARNKVFGFYTSAHWIAFLRGFALTAGLAGDSVSSSTMTVNGFSMQCVDFRAPGVPGTSTICTTAQGILGYVKVASNTTTFEIKSYTSSPPAALFELPPGAKVTTLQTGTT